MEPLFKPVKKYFFLSAEKIGEKRAQHASKCIVFTRYLANSKITGAPILRWLTDPSESGCKNLPTNISDHDF